MVHFHRERKSEDNTHARILLADDLLTDFGICEPVCSSIGPLYKARENYCGRGFTAIHRRKLGREYERKPDGDAEANLIKLAHIEQPEEYARWTFHLLTDEFVLLNEIDFKSISHGSIRQRLKNVLKPHFYDYWTIPAE